MLLSMCVYYNRDLGCGKTCFARGFVRELTDDAALQVTSPTYLLVNTYEQPASSEIYHVDLYRLDSVSKQDMAALGLAEAFSKGHGAMSCERSIIVDSSGLTNNPVYTYNL